MSTDNPEVRDLVAQILATDEGKRLASKGRVDPSVYAWHDEYGAQIAVRAVTLLLRDADEVLAHRLALAWLRAASELRRKQQQRPRSATHEHDQKDT